MALLIDVIFLLVVAVTSPLWLIALLKTGKWRTDWAGRFGRVPHAASRAEAQTEASQPQEGAMPKCTLMIHAVSVGEVDATRKLVALLEQAHPDWRLVISTTTNTGYARAASLYADRHDVVRYPFDFSPAVRRLLNTIKPDGVALMENEVWPNFMLACGRRKIPVCVLNGRLTARSHKRYRMLGFVIRSIYRRLWGVAAQTDAIAQRFRDVGAPADQVVVLDTMKWDTAEITVGPIPGAHALAAAMGIDTTKPVIVAGSTGPGEEQLLIDTCPPEAQLVLVPRKPERFEEVASLAPMIRRSTQPDGSTPPTDFFTPGSRRLFLVDTMGELTKTYSLADVCIVGRSFLGLYGSNPMEPASLGKPTLIGPHHSDFAAVVETMQSTGGIVVTDKPGETTARLLADKEEASRIAAAGCDVIRQRQGSTQRHVELLERMFRETQPPAS